MIHVANYLNNNDLCYLSLHYGPLQDSFIIKTSYICYLTNLAATKTKICIHGPKGVGKSFSLMYLMCCRKASDTFVFLSPEISDQGTINHLQTLESQSSETDIVKKLESLSQSLGTKLTILIDLGSFTDCYTDHIKRVIKVISLCHKSRVILANTSGSGYFTPSKKYERFIHFTGLYFAHCRILNFTRKETKLYMKESFISKPNLEEIRKATNYNPYLVSFYASQHSNIDYYNTYSNNYM